MGFVLRRSLISLVGLVGLVLAVGVVAVVFLGAPPWFPAALATGLILAQYLVSPRIVEWLVPDRVIELEGGHYATDHVVGEMVVRRCRDAGIPVVKLGIVDDGTPNAFTFGHHRGDARIWITRGLLERLDESELDAVVAHEVGHIKHRDFIVMTIAAVVPMMLYLTSVTLRRNSHAAVVGWSAYVAYVVSSVTLRALSRARELAADHWSCECTGNGDALSSALVKIAYGMGQADAARKMEADRLVAHGWKSDARKLQARNRRAQSMRAMGIFDPKTADALATAFAGGVDPERAVAAMRWDLVNPWGRTLEKLSTHPLVAHRIEALERSDLPGRPRTWNVVRAAATVDPTTSAAIRAQYRRELLVAIAPWVLTLAALAVGFFDRSLFTVGCGLVVVGVLFLVKQGMRYRAGFRRVNEVAGLLEHLEAGPIAGIPVELRGTLIGRGFPGYVLSPDLVLQDRSGFVPLRYRQPVPFLAALFGLCEVKDWLGAEVIARGWYRRGPQPYVELQLVRSRDRRARAWQWLASWVGSFLVTVVGIVLVAVGYAN